MVVKLIYFLILFLIIKTSFILDNKTYLLEDIINSEKIPKNDLIEIYNIYSGKLNKFENGFVQILKLNKEINSNDYSYLEENNTNATQVFILESCYNIMKANYSSDIYYLFIIDEFPNENSEINYMNKFNYIIFDLDGKKLIFLFYFVKKILFIVKIILIIIKQQLI